MCLTNVIIGVRVTRQQKLPGVALGKCRHRRAWCQGNQGGDSAAAVQLAHHLQVHADQLVGPVQPDRAVRFGERGGVARGPSDQAGAVDPAVVASPSRG